MSIDEIEEYIVSVSDPEVNVQFWCVCLAEMEREYRELFTHKNTPLILLGISKNSVRFLEMPDEFYLSLYFTTT